MSNRSLFIAAILLIVAVISLFVGYFVGADMARRDNRADPVLTSSAGSSVSLWH